MRFQPSEDCFNLIREFELCELSAYWDEDGGVWTCGWGATGPDVNKATRWTQEEADARLKNDVQRHYEDMCRLVKVELTQGQVDGLTDWIYNLGAPKLASSTLLRVLNFGEYTKVPDQIRRWVYAGGEVNERLKQRREREVSLWNKAA